MQTLILKNEISIFDESPINVILLSTNDGTTLNAIWKQRKNTWYVVESGNEKNLIDILLIVFSSYSKDLGIQNYRCKSTSSVATS